MTNGLRITLWVLSSLAVLWTVIALVGVFTMGCCGMMAGGMMGGGEMMRGMQGGAMMGGGWVTGMMLQMTLTWVVILDSVGVFVYLIVSARRPMSATDLIARRPQGRSAVSSSSRPGSRRR